MKNDTDPVTLFIKIFITIRNIFLSTVRLKIFIYWYFHIVVILPESFSGIFSKISHFNAKNGRNII